PGAPSASDCRSVRRARAWHRPRAREAEAARLRPRRPSRIEPGGAMGAEESAAAVAPVEVGGRAQLARRAGVVSAAVLVSRVLGLVREQAFAVFFGAGRELDAFITAFRIPNLLRDLFAEGALSAAFVTTFTWRLEPGYLSGVLGRGPAPDPGLVTRAMTGMAIGTLAGGLLQLLVQVPSLWRVGFRYRPLLALRDPGLRQVARLMGPATIGAAAV